MYHGSDASQAPPGYYPIELVQFWRDKDMPLHWALFVRTDTTGGMVYELVGTPETYTAQFLPSAIDPATLADWRGTRLIGWVHPTHLAQFERAVEQVPVWRGRADWWCQQWVYDVMQGVRGCRGVYVVETSLEGLQRHMERLLDAWESGDI